MDNLRNAIKLYFDGMNIEESFCIEQLESKTIQFDKNSFFSNAHNQTAFKHRTDDELENIFRKVSEDWMFMPENISRDLVKSPYYLLTHFNNQVLKEVEAEPFVHYHHLLKWRDVSFPLGEDIFTTSFLAYRDIIARKSRKYFSWRPTLFSDNRRLNSILQKGVAENHSHLWASSLTFDLNWLALMNHYPFYRNEVREFIKGRRLSNQINTQFESKSVEFEVQLKKVIALRVVLYESINFYTKSLDKKYDLNSYLKQKDILDFDIQFLFKPSNSIESFDLILSFQKIQDHINLLGQQFALKLPHNGKMEVVDYALSKSISPQNFKGCYFLAGERKLLYDAFKIVYTNLENGEDVTTFGKILYSYLLIKNSFRKEMIQLNGRFGFSNFKNYQDRKTNFIEGKTFYTTIFLDISLNYNTDLMNIVSNEYRIGPKYTANGLKKVIDGIMRVRKYHQSDYDWEKKLLGTDNPLNIITQENIRTKEFCFENTFFVIHFFKKQDYLFYKNDGKSHYQNLIILQHQRSRDFELRKTVKTHAESIKNVREQFPEFAKIIRGIDAASSEIVARPEAFAQAFRYLKNHQIRENYSEIKGKIVNNRLNITFHAGEDFFDIVDGLRYIDECLFFLNMEHGDRFGHAIALGIDVNNYFKLKDHKLVLSKHMILDNIAWLLSKVRKFGLGQHINEVYRLENLFKSLFSEVYLNSCDSNRFQHIHYQQYFDAWKLRGDDPTLYYEYFTKQEKKGLSIEQYFESKKNITYWERCRLNNTHYKLNSIRKREEISRLYFEYHYNPKVKNKGFEMKQFEITSSYVQLVTDVQKAMMQYVGSKNISIETNPTSNFLIGPIQKYIEHPILNWYNLGLETDPTKIQDSPQLSVSINTDDAGIFSTSLENEYALLAIALEKEKDENGKPKYKPAMIYDWLDRIREMGLQQSFLNEHK